MGLNIKKIKIDDIKPASYNPRKIQQKDFEKLSNSIKEFGLVDPIIINLKNNPGKSFWKTNWPLYITFVILITLSPH